MEAQKQTFQKKKNTGKKKQQAHSADIVFTRNGTIQTIPSLTKRLKMVTDPVIGLKFVWEYRSPTKSVPPHYQCKLCKVAKLQNEMAAHITGWKHNFRYMKHSHADKVPHEEEEATKDPAIRSAIRSSAAEVEKTEGRGQIRIVIKEPGEVIAFQNMKSARPSVSGLGPGALLPRGRLAGGLFGGGFPEPLFPEFPLRGGMMSDGLSGSARFSGPDNMPLFPNSRSMSMGSDGFGIGPRNEGMGGLYPDDLPLNSSSSRIMGRKDSESKSTLSTLLTYLDTFRIECEDDAQIVLKITQKLTDVLMEYRLRSISSGNVKSTTPSSSLSNMNYSSCLPLNSIDSFSNDRFSSDRFSNDRLSSDRFSNDQLSSNRFSSDRLSSNRFSSDRLSSNRFSNDRLSSNMPGPSRFYN
ncbi:uncharacterized protein si:ch211-197h24.6 [Trichomycterus rosablanca]|uniref:uncharacterized protein si:ch211-197h24.6 n=1 Tax=Trichomycterus rosablanca TaxID=2290929 RepID=UPI002F351F46